MYKLLLGVVFTVLCKPGVIYQLGEIQTELAADEGDSYYYFYNIDLEDGAYLYVSNYEKDSVWFLIENSEIEYLFPKQKFKNEKFEFSY